MRWSAASIVSTGPIEHRWLAREVPDEPPRGPKLLERVREALRVRHYSRRTEKRTSAGSADTPCFTASGTHAR